MLSYEATTGGLRHYLVVRPAEIVIGSSAGSGHSDNAVTCTHAAFLTGAYNADVERTFGRDVLAAVRAACVDATDDPFFGAVGAERDLLTAWAGLDRDPGLATLAEAPDETWRAYGDETLTRVSTAGTDLVVTEDRGLLRFPDAEVRLDGDLSGAIAWDGRFYVTDRLHAHAFGADGARIASTAETPLRFGIASAVRIDGVVRRGDAVGVTYWTVGSASSPTQRLLGDVGVFVLGDASEIARWSPYSRSAAAAHRRAARRRIAGGA